MPLLCIECGASPAQGYVGVLWRLNTKGEPGIWGCDKHAARLRDDAVHLLMMLDRQPTATEASE